MRNGAAFTLIETMIAISIIGLLTGFTSITAKEQIDKAHDATRKSDLNKIKIALEHYNNDRECYPTQEEWSQMLCNQKTGVLGNYLDSFPCDPNTKTPYYYERIDNQGNACNGSCAQCPGYRLMAKLTRPSDPDITAIGCDPTGCGVTDSNNRNPNYGIAMGANVPVPGFIPGNGENTGHTDKHDCKHSKDPGCSETETPTPTVAPVNTVTPTPASEELCPNYKVTLMLGKKSTVPLIDGKYYYLSGSADGQFSYPEGVEIDSQGNIIVTDTNNHRVQKFDSSGKFITKWGSEGTGNGQFHMPWGIAIDAQDNIYISDSDWYAFVPNLALNRIQKFDQNGNYLSQWGSHGTATGQFGRPAHIVLDGLGNIYIADVGSPQGIHKYSITGNFLLFWGGSGTGDGKYWNPWAVEIAPDGNILTGDINNHIQEFTPEGIFINQWGVKGEIKLLPPGEHPAEFFAPIDIETGPGGKIYILDNGNNRIQIFDANRKYIQSLWVTEGPEDGQFRIPNDMAVDKFGNIYVAGANNHSITKFSCVN